MRGIVGIDPGITGALAFLFDGKWALYDMPLCNEKGSDKQEIDVTGLVDLLNLHKPQEAFLERAAPMPSIGRSAHRSMGATSAFRYGGSYYAVRAVLQCCGIPCTLVAPQKWKKHFELRGSNKEDSRQKALALYPKHKDELKFKYNHAKAEAMLIALWGDEVGE
jgi:crossover junction endodeoxyribonuclease RuvC